MPSLITFKDLIPGKWYSPVFSEDSISSGGSFFYQGGKKFLGLFSENVDCFYNPDTLENVPVDSAFGFIDLE